jgi:hypothetical protein
MSSQRRESGYDVLDVEASVPQALEGGDGGEIERAHLALEETGMLAGWGYEEPTALAEIEAVLPEAPAVPGLTLTDDELRDRLLGVDCAEF